MITVFLSIVIYVFAVMSVMLFGDIEGVGEKYFGNLGLVLFVIWVATLDSRGSKGYDTQSTRKACGSPLFRILHPCNHLYVLTMFIAVFTNAIASADIEDGDDVGFSRIINELKNDIRFERTLLMPVVKVEEEE